MQTVLLLLRVGNFGMGMPCVSPLYICQTRNTNVVKSSFCQTSLSHRMKSPDEDLRKARNLILSESFRNLPMTSPQP